MSAPVKGRCAEDFLESGVTLPVPVTEPHWYLTVHATQCLLCGRDQYPEERVRIAGERPADPNLRHVYEEGDYACGEHFM